METNLPVVTVVLPTYNCENYVRESIQSILDQTFTGFELIVIDDASTDRTVQVIGELKDPRIRLIQKQKNSGYTDSLNQGIALARGRYIARMDADDISLPSRFEKQVNFLELHKDIAVCGTWYMEIPNNHIAKLPTEHEDIKIGMLENNQLCHPSVMFKKDFFEANHLCYNRDFESAEDYELWTRLIAIGKLANLPDVLLHYRMHEQQVSTKHVYTQHARALICRRKMLLYLLDDCSAEEEKVLDKILAAERIRSGPEFENALALFDRLVQKNEEKG
ncbi:MAG TPA: glycosyltransferase, partial [Flavisolibacter sp.]|nr:glycosyltransferase [Flavisolibacter sp.]